jgi:hypothetical protein
MKHIFIIDKYKENTKQILFIDTLKNIGQMLKGEI